MEMGNENLGSQACIDKAGGTFGRGEEGGRGRDFGQEGLAPRGEGSRSTCSTREQRQRHEGDFRREPDRLILKPTWKSWPLKMTSNILKNRSKMEMGQGEMETCSFKA